MVLKLMVLLGPEKCDASYLDILKVKKNCITYVFPHNYVRTRINSFEYL